MCDKECEVVVGRGSWLKPYCVFCQVLVIIGRKLIAISRYDIFTCAEKVLISYGCIVNDVFRFCLCLCVSLLMCISATFVIII